LSTATDDRGKEYGARGIRSNNVAPGGILANFNNAAIRSNPQAQQWIIAQTAMGHPRGLIRLCEQGAPARMARENLDLCGVALTGCCLMSNHVH
jgi:NAD(P)-dependent dehydrogenase (short-subunit alcohol dehydrogenase family)